MDVQHIPCTSKGGDADVDGIEGGNVNVAGLLKRFQGSPLVRIVEV